MPTYVPYYQNDIFVSYAPVDNEPLAGAQHGWVTTLVNGLKTLLKQKIGHADAYCLWMDEVLAGHETHTQEVVTQLHSSALLMLILSPAYLASKQQELELFLAQSGRNSGRIFVVERDYVEQRPKALQDLLGYKFWVTDERNDQPRILAIPQPKPEEIEYYQRLDDLARQMTSQLKSLKAEIEAVTLTRPPSQSLPIFLAEVTDDLEQHYQELQRYFDQVNIPYLPQKTHFFAPDIQTALDRDLAQCQAFVQLLSDKAGKGYPLLQYERAQCAGLPIYQWRDRQLEWQHLQDKTHLNLLMGDTVIAATLVEFQTYVLEQLSQGQQLELPNPEDNLVFINATPEDRPLAQDIVAWLGQYETIGYSLPLDITATTQAEAIRANLEQNLLSCDAVMVIYAQASVVWVTEQLLYCRRMQGRREQPLKVIVVYDKPSATQPPLTLKLPHMHVLTCPQPETCLPQLIQLLHS